MTNSNHTVEETVPVIQADRDAAADWHRMLGGMVAPYTIEEAFARHRLASHSTHAGEDVERVRGLNWSEPHPSHSYPQWLALDYAIRFEARIDTSLPSRWGKYPLSINGNMVDEKFDTPETAKDWAQKDYAERILDALSLPPSTHNDELVDALREAHTVIAVSIAFLGRDRGTDRQEKMLDGLTDELVAADKMILAALTAAAIRAALRGSAQPRRRSHDEQVAYDSGHGRRDISHHADNPYDPASNPGQHRAYDEGFSDRDKELS